MLIAAVLIDDVADRHKLSLPRSADVPQSCKDGASKIDQVVMLPKSDLLEAENGWRIGYAATWCSLQQADPLQRS